MDSCGIPHPNAGPQPYRGEIPHCSEFCCPQPADDPRFVLLAVRGLLQIIPDHSEDIRVQPACTGVSKPMPAGNPGARGVYHGLSSGC